MKAVPRSYPLLPFHGRVATSSREENTYAPPVFPLFFTGQLPRPAIRDAIAGDQDLETFGHSREGTRRHSWPRLPGLANDELPITIDRNMPHRQNLRGRGISLIVPDGRSTSIDDLDVLQRGEFLRISGR